MGAAPSFRSRALARVSIKNLGRSSAYAYAAEIWRIASRLVLTPIILKQIGLDGYGVWTLLFSVCSYVTVVNTSFGLAYTKFTAEHDAKGDYRGLSALVGAGMTLIGSIGFIGLGTLWWFSIPILSGLRVPDAMLSDASQAFLLVAICVFARMSIGTVFQVLAGLQRMDVRYKLDILASGVEFTIALILLTKGWGLLGLATGHLVGQAVSTALAFWACRRFCPLVRFSPFQATRSAFRQVALLGGRFQLLHFVNLLNAKGFRLVMSALLGPGSLAVYEIASRLIGLGDAVGSAISAPMMPAFANLHFHEGGAKARSLLKHGSKAICLIAVISFGFLAVFAPRVIELWIGEGQATELAAWTVRCMAVGYLVKQLTAIGTSSLRGKGTVLYEVESAIISGAVWLILVYPFYRLWDFPGLVVCATLSLLAGSVWFLGRFCRTEAISLLTYAAQALLRPLLVLSPVFVAAVAARSVGAFEFNAASGRWGILLELAIWGVFVGLGCLLFAWFAVLSQHERGALLGLVLRHRLGPVAEKSVVP